MNEADIKLEVLKNRVNKLSRNELIEVITNTVYALNEGYGNGEVVSMVAGTLDDFGIRDNN